MVSIGLLVIVAVIAVAIWSRRHTLKPPTLIGSDARTVVHAADRSPVDDWVAAQIISSSQADQIREFESQRRPSPDRRISLAAEAVGYLGAVLISASLVVFVANHWEDLPLGGRLALGAVGAIVFGTLGWMLRRSPEPAFMRLRSVSLVLSVGGLAFFAGVLGADGFDWKPESVVLLIGSACTPYAGLLWRFVRLELQQLVTFAAVLTAGMGALGVAGADRPALYASVVFAIGAAWLALSRWPPFGPEIVAQMLGAVATVVATLIFSGDFRGAGLIAGVATAATLIALSVQWRAPIILAVGVIGLFIITPQLVLHFLGDAVGVPVALFASGIVVIAIALLLPRLRRLSRS